VSVVSGGLLCILGAGVIAVLAPSFRRYHAPAADGVPAAQAAVSAGPDPSD
jgi:hypothetical protein